MMGKELNNSITPGSKSILQVKRSLIEELDKIDEEFQMPGKDLNAKGAAEDVLAPDDIRIGVDQDEDDEFQEELDYEGDGTKLFTLSRKMRIVRNLKMISLMLRLKLLQVKTHSMILSLVIQ